MNANEIFQRLSDDEAHQLFGWVEADDREAYRKCLALAAMRRKLRAIFLEKKPRTERHSWMRRTLAGKANEDLAVELLQTWLLGPGRPMLVRFLDSLGVVHKDGLMDAVPAQPPEGELAAAVDGLFGEFDPVAVKIYLNFFQPVEEESWPTFDTMLASDPRLVMGSEG